VTEDQVNRILARIDALRIETKADLASMRNEYMRNLTSHEASDRESFRDINKSLVDLATWKTKTMAYGSVAAFVLTFFSAALASGRLPIFG